jgi:S-adenosylmethionine:tRNA ribosyltransferase-isomerase
VHVSTELPAGLWLVEARTPLPSGSTAPFDGDLAGVTLTLAGGARAHLHARYTGSTRLWVATLDGATPVAPYLERHGRAIRYSYVGRDWPLSAYQTVYATDAGVPRCRRPAVRSRPRSSALVAHGVGVTPLLLHTACRRWKARAAVPGALRVPAGRPSG